MYDTKSRELRWNATFSEYSAPLCEESYQYSEWNCSSRGTQLPAGLWGDSARASGCAPCWGQQAAAHGWWQNWG